MSARSTKTGKGRDTSAPGGARYPLWRDAIEVETTLRPVVPPRPPGSGRIPYLHLAATSVVAAGTSMGAAIYLYRRGLVISRLQRPRQLQGPPIASIRQLALRPRVIAAAWQPAAIAFGVAVVVWLLCLAIPRLRTVALRWGWIPALLGVAGYLAVSLRMMPVPN